MVWPLYLDPDAQYNKEICVCEPCRPVLMHQEAVSCGWTMEATNLVDGSSAYNAVSCNSGQKMCFNDSTDITFSGDNALLLDSIIIYGHNMTTGTVSVSPHNIFGGASDVGGGDGCGCIDDDCPITIIRDLVIPSVGSAVNEVVVSIVSEGLICIDRIVLALKMPIDFKASTFKNPFDGTDRETEQKESSCGPLITSTKRVKVPLTLDLPCVPCDYVNDEWRCYLKWAVKNGFIFRPCINTAPNDVFMGTLNDNQPPSQFADRSRCTKNLQIQATGYITPPPCKVDADLSDASGNGSGDGSGDGDGSTDDCPEVRCLSIKKRADPGPYELGDVVSYQFIVENCGNATETGVTINDSLLDNPSISIGTLAAGASTVVTGTRVVTTSDVLAGRISNIGGVSSDAGTSDADVAVVLTQGDIDDDAEVRCMSLTKEADPGPYKVGTEIIYTIIVKNCGNVTETNVAVSDALLNVQPSNIGQLLPDQSVTITGSYTVTDVDIDLGRVDNTATVTTDSGTSASDTETVLTEDDDTVVDDCGYLDCSLANVRIFERDQDTGNLGNEISTLDGCNPSFLLVDWVDNCGNYMGDGVPVAGRLDVTNGIGSEVLDTYLGGLTNRYIYTPSNNTSATTVNFGFGANDPDGNLVTCNFSLPVDACVGLPNVVNLDDIDKVALGDWDASVWAEIMGITPSFTSNMQLLSLIEEDGKCKIRQEHIATSGGSANVIAFHNIPDRQEMCIEQTFEFDTNFTWGTTSYSGKMGCYMGGGSNVTGGQAANDGWTLRPAWDANGELTLYSYAWSDTQINANGFGWENGTGYFITPGVPFTMKICAQMNSSAAASDGAYQVWVNGNLVLSETGIQFMSVGTPNINRKGWSEKHGGADGGWSPTSPTGIQTCDISWG